MTMYRGIDYYPEHWNHDMIETDLERFSSLGVNLIRIGEFAWHKMEPIEGTYDFSFFDMVIARAKAKGFKIMFGTPTATFPAWIGKKYPTVFLKHDQTMQYGGRREYCYNSKVYQRLTTAIVSKLVAHYANETAIVAWQIDNEIGHEGSDYCTCGKCELAFQQYLEAKYHTIGQLNEVWGSIFWGHTYNSFDEIALPKTTITFFNPTQLLDFYRFRSSTASNFIGLQAQTIRAFKGAHQSVTHDFPGGVFAKWYNHNEVAQHLDFVSYNNYPVWGGLKAPILPSENALQLDFMRGLLGKNFTITEQLMGAQGHQYIGYLPRKMQGYLWSMQAMAHGCEHLYYFRERSFHKGQEQFCYGLYGHENRENRRTREAKQFFHDIEAYEKEIETPIKSKVAILYDYDAICSWRIQPQSTTFDVTSEIHRLYRPFHAKNVLVDVIEASKDFSSYDVIVLPVMQIVDKPLAKRLLKFTEQKGTIVFSFRSGLKDRDNNVYFNVANPGLLHGLCGIEIEEVEALQEGQTQLLNDGAFVDVWRDMITPTTAKTLYHYTDEFSEYACVTKNKYHHANVYYIGGGLDAQTMDKLVTSILEEQQIKWIESEEFVEVVERGDYYVIMNHNVHPVICLDHKLEAYEVKWLKK
ncbi:MAG: beta-galactosidase [Erysipelotrichaceae bacterium]